jgi:glycosyltransferase involved in cell wall biosynthesis
MNNRILAFTENYVGGGSNRYFIDSVRILAKKYDITVAANHGAFSAAEQSRFGPPGIITSIFLLNLVFFYIHLSGIRSLWLILKIILLIVSPILTFYSFCRLFVLVLTVRPKFIFCVNGGHPGAYSIYLLALIGRLRGIRSVICIVSTPQRRKYITDKLYDRLFQSLNAVVIANCVAVKNELVFLRDFRTENVSVVYNGLSADTIHRVSPESDVLRVFGYLGRLDEGKGLKYLIEGFAQVARHHTDIELHIAGSGPYQTSLARRISELGIQQRVKFLGFVEETEKFLNSIDVLIFPSLHEGFPYSILEAMRSGLPILSTAIGGVPEAIEHLKSGYLVHTASSDDLRDGIIYFYNNSAKARTIGKNAQEKFNASFTFEAMEQALEHEIQKISNIEQPRKRN